MSCLLGFFLPLFYKHTIKNISFLGCFGIRPYLVVEFWKPPSEWCPWSKVRIIQEKIWASCFKHSLCLNLIIFQKNLLTWNSWLLTKDKCQWKLTGQGNRPRADLFPFASLLLVDPFHKSNSFSLTVQPVGNFRLQCPWKYGAMLSVVVSK